MDECLHENQEYEAGNYVPGFGWEIVPGMYCLDCEERLEEGEEYNVFADPDMAHKYELEDEMRNPL